MYRLILNQLIYTTLKVFNLEEQVVLLEKYNIDFKNMLYHPVFFINDVIKNEQYILKLIVREHLKSIGNI